MSNAAILGILLLVVVVLLTGVTLVLNQRLLVARMKIKGLEAHMDYLRANNRHLNEELDRYGAPYENV